MFPSYVSRIACESMVAITVAVAGARLVSVGKHGQTSYGRAKRKGVGHCTAVPHGRSACSGVYSILPGSQRIMSGKMMHSTSPTIMSTINGITPLITSLVCTPNSGGDAALTKKMA